MKLVAKIAFLAFVFLALALALHAEPVSQLKPTDYVNDFAHVLDPNTIAQLDNICQQIDRKPTLRLRSSPSIRSTDQILTVMPSICSRNGASAAKATDRGVLILLAVQDHNYRIEVGYGLEPILPDGKVGGFGREAVPLLKQNDYNSAVSTDDDARGGCDRAGRRHSADRRSSSRPDGRGKPRRRDVGWWNHCSSSLFF